jgi:hypothetical protein
MLVAPLTIDWMPDQPSVELWYGKDERGTRSLWARWLSDGSLRIEGQDLGRGVSVLGEGLSEYEWQWVVEAEDVPRVVELLGSPPGTDPIAAIRAWVLENKGGDPGNALKQAGLSMVFWSRLGD